MRWKPLLWFLWVVLPLATVGFESTCRICAQEIADPLRTWLHYVLLGGLPLVLGVVLVRIERAPAAELPRYLGVLGATVGIAGYFAVLLAQAAWIGVIALLALGLGLLALSPLLLTVSATLAILRLRRKAREVLPHARVWPGVLVGLLLMVAIDARWILTELALRWAGSNDVAVQARGLAWLRGPLGSEDQLLRAGVFLSRTGSFAPVLNVVAGKPMDPWAARRLYFSATGKDFETELADQLPPGRGRFWLEGSDGSWRGDRPSPDDLVLTSSRLDGLASPDAFVGYVEWTFVVENNRGWDREGWATLQLPAGGVVSRATLWINGEEREAAFGGRDQTIRAYEAVTARRRDPLLVTSAGPDRVALRFFPVPRKGSMKFRLGITFPMTIEDAGNKASVVLPRLKSTNVFVSEKFAHEVWYEAHHDAVDVPAGLSQEASPRGEITLRGGLSDARVREVTLTFLRSAGIKRTIAPLPGEPAPADVILQELQQRESRALGATIVLDGSPRFFREHVRSLGEALQHLEPRTAVQLVIAGEQPLWREFADPKEAGAFLQRSLREEGFAAADGTRYPLPHRAGFDNLPALADAVRRVAGTGGAVIWIHGVQPPRPDFERVLQVLARRDAQLRIVEVAAEQWQIEDVRGLEEKLPVTRQPLTAAGLKAALAPSPWEIVRTRVARADLSESLPSTLRHVTRLWAADEVSRLVRQTPSARTAATQLAIAHQLVTPVSGAVVLETQKQYDEHKLKPADPKTVPVVPEPQTYAFMLAAMIGVLLWRRWHGRRVRGP